MHLAEKEILAVTILEVQVKLGYSRASQDLQFLEFWPFRKDLNSLVCLCPPYPRYSVPTFFLSLLASAGLGGMGDGAY